jgi:toxin ParE1/3/4
MAYLVRISLRAELDLDSVYVAVNAEDSDAALRWFNLLELALFTLEENPTRCPATPENAYLKHLLYGKKPHIYRVIYRIVEDRKGVDILHIHHCAGQAFKPGDLK